MNFSSPDVESVFAQYEQRRADEAERMAALPKSVGMQKRDEFLLAVGPETGWFLHSLVVASRPSLILELGTSYGYSTLFLADAAAQIDARVISIDCAAEKTAYAEMQLRKARLERHVELIIGDAVAEIGHIQSSIDFVLLDIWKELYLPCFDAVYPKLSVRGLIAADNMIFPSEARDDVRKYRQRVRDASDLTSTLLPIGSGVELTGRWPNGHPDL